MLRVYLDQNKWVDLARAASGHTLGARFEDALAMARAGVRVGSVSFPLDMYRYWETSKRRNDRSRNDVIDVMRELSRHHTIALPSGVLDAELDLALQRRFGRHQRPRYRQVFGLGVRHIAEGRFNWPALDLSALPGDVSVPVGLRALLNGALGEAIEARLLCQGRDTFTANGFDQVASELGQSFVDFENVVAGEIAKQGLTGEGIDQAVRATDFGDIRPAVVEALGRIGMTYDEFMQRVRPDELLSFMDDLPTRYVTNVMRSAKHRETQQHWEPNDFIDILALPVAVVYCDVVITEKQWAHRLRQGKVAERYGTFVLNDAADLVDILVHAAPKS